LHKCFEMHNQLSFKKEALHTMQAALYGMRSQRSVSPTPLLVLFLLPYFVCHLVSYKFPLSILE
jgi:hypothetical protein